MLHASWPTPARPVAESAARSSPRGRWGCSRCWWGIYYGCWPSPAWLWSRPGAHGPREPKSPAAAPVAVQAMCVLAAGDL